MKNLKPVGETLAEVFRTLYVTSESNYEEAIEGEVSDRARVQTHSDSDLLFLQRLSSTR